ncbi:MAG: hypothetical protein ACON5B_10235 [Myxococcota bacterium]
MSSLKRQAGWVSAALLIATSTMDSSAYASAGDHIRLGATTIVPGVSLGFEGRSNAYLAAGEFITGQPRDRVTPALNLYLAPELGLKTATPQFLFKFDAKYELRKYIVPTRTSNLDRFNDFRVGISLDALRQSVVGFDLKSTVVNRNQNSDNPFFNSALLTQLRTDNRLRLNFRVGPDLVFSAGGRLDWQNYQIPGVSAQRGFNSRSTYGATFDAKWNFFPRTAGVIEASYLQHRWRSNWLSTSDAFGSMSGPGTYGDFLALPDSDHVKVMTGIRGRFTKRLVLVAMLGYGWGNYLPESVTAEAGRDSGEADPASVGFDADVKGLDALLVLLKAEADFGFLEERKWGQRLTAMYRKDFQDSFFVNYVEQNHVLAVLDSRWAPMVTTNIKAGVRFEGYKGETSAARRDVFLTVDARSDIEVLPWMSISPRVMWNQRASQVSDVEYDDVQGHIMLNMTY